MNNWRYLEAVIIPALYIETTPEIESDIKFTKGFYPLALYFSPLLQF